MYGFLCPLLFLLYLYIYIYILLYVCVGVCVCACGCVCVWGQPLFLRDLRTTLFSVFPDVACNSKSPRAARLNEVAAGLSGTTSICGAAALGRALGFGTSSMSGTSANRARHWRAYRWARVRLSPFFWPEKDQECYRWTVDVYSAEASTPFQALFASRLVALVLLGAPFLVLLCVARSLHRARVSIGMIHARCSARTRPRALAGASPGDSSPLPLSRPTARRVAPWTELCEGNAVLHQLPLEPSYVGRGVAASAPPFQPSLVPFSAARAPVSQRPSLSSSPSSRLLAFSL